MGHMKDKIIGKIVLQTFDSILSDFIMYKLLYHDYGKSKLLTQSWVVLSCTNFSIMIMERANFWLNPEWFYHVQTFVSWLWNEQTFDSILSGFIMYKLLYHDYRMRKLLTQSSSMVLSYTNFCIVIMEWANLWLNHSDLIFSGFIMYKLLYHDYRMSKLRTQSSRKVLSCTNLCIMIMEWANLLHNPQVWIYHEQTFISWLWNEQTYDSILKYGFIMYKLLVSWLWKVQTFDSVLNGFIMYKLLYHGHGINKTLLLSKIIPI